MSQESTVLAQSAACRELRHDWTHSEVEAIYTTPLPELVYRAQTIHRQFHARDRVQTCQLISIKTGGCPEDCAYCPQSAHYNADVERQGLLDPQHVIGLAREAASRGVTRFCMGAAWREAPQGREFQKVLEMVRGVSALGMEVCCTLGMLTEMQAVQLKKAGLTAYNHNLDTSPDSTVPSSPRARTKTACAHLRRYARRALPYVAAEFSAWAKGKAIASACCTN
jgi:biotin synthase